MSSWLHGSGVTDLQLVPNHLYVYAQASTATFSKLLNVQINDYTLPGNSFYAPDRVPTLPSSVSGDVTWIAGLSNQDKIQTRPYSHIGRAVRPHARRVSPLTAP